MGSLRFLLSRRWLMFFVVVVGLTLLAWRLGVWQFNRLEDRREANRIVEMNERRDPVAVTDVLAPGRPVAEDDEWRLITATGTYDPDNTIVVRYQVRKHTSGLDVVVPLILPDGTALMVDRGWMQASNTGDLHDGIPEPPPGEVTITGWVRADGTGDSTRVTNNSTRAVNSDRMGEALGLENLTGFVQLKSEDPAPANPLAPVELPELNDGPHFFYGLQWWFFGALAVFGFCYLLYDEWRGPRSPARESTRNPPRPGRRRGQHENDEADEPDQPASETAV